MIVIYDHKTFTVQATGYAPGAKVIKTITAVSYEFS
jgi:hypothetical protein